MRKRGCAGGGQVICNRAQKADPATSHAVQIAGIGFLIGRHMFAHPIRAERGVQIAAVVIVQLKFLAGLVLIHCHQHIAQFPL